MVKNSDIAIIKGCKKNEAASQRALFEKYSSVLFATCYRYVANHEDAKDVLQDSFIRIFKYFKNFNPQKGSLKNWMLKICINESLKKINAKKSMLDLENLPVEPTVNPVVLDNFMMEDLIRMFSSLPTMYRTVLNLHLVEGYSHEEIAKQLNIKISNSRKILSRAKKLIVKKFNLLNASTWI